MATFKPRTTAPDKSNKYFIHYSKGGYNTCIIIDEKTGWVMPNCVGYAQGRLLEILGKKATNWKLPACNAEDWYATAEKNGLEVGATPKLGAVICWKAGKVKNGSDGAGHVAVVEEIKPNGDIVVSQSAYGGNEFYLSTITKASGYVYSNNRQLVGFIYCGLEFEATKPAVTPASYNVGDTVEFTGCLHYTSAYATGVAKACKAGLAKVINICKGKPHPYCLQAVAGKGSTVHGWVNEEDIKAINTSNTTATTKPTKKPNIKAGAKITLKATNCYTSETAKNSYGKKTGTFYLWDNVVKSGRIRITNRADRVGVAGQVTCWVNVADIT